MDGNHFWHASLGFPSQSFSSKLTESVKMMACVVWLSLTETESIQVCFHFLYKAGCCDLTASTVFVLASHSFPYCKAPTDFVFNHSAICAHNLGSPFICCFWLVRFQILKFSTCSDKLGQLLLWNVMNVLFHKAFSTSENNSKWSSYIYNSLSVLTSLVIKKKKNVTNNIKSKSQQHTHTQA